MLIIPGLAFVGMLAYIVRRDSAGAVPQPHRAAHRARVPQGLDPRRELRRYENEARLGGNVASRQRYAEELVRHARYDEAIAQYRQALDRAVRA